MDKLHEVKRYKGNLMDDIAAAAEMAELPEGCHDIGQIKSSEEIFRDMASDFNRIFGVGK